MDDEHPAVMKELSDRLSLPVKTNPYNVQGAVVAFEAAGIKWGSLTPREICANPNGMVL